MLPFNLPELLGVWSPQFPEVRTRKLKVCEWMCDVCDVCVYVRVYVCI